MGLTEKLKLPRIKSSTISIEEIESNAKRGNSINNSFEQYHYLCADKQTEWSTSSSSSIPRKRNLELVNQEQGHLKSSPCKRRRELTCRYSQQKKGFQQPSQLVFIQRINEGNSKILWRFANRPLSKSQQFTRGNERIFSDEDSQSSRCFSNESVAKSVIRASAEHFNHESNSQISTFKNPNDFSHSIMEKPTVVSDSAEAQHSITTNTSSKELTKAIKQNSRMDTINQSIAYENLSTSSKEILENSERKQTRKSYESGWKNFHYWCKQSGKDANEYEISKAINYLAELAKTNPKSVLLHRTAISTTWKSMYPEKEAFGENDLTRKFIKGIRQKFPKEPPSKKESWCMNEVLKFCRDLNNENVTLKVLSCKLAMLIALSSFWRLRYDLSRIYI